MLPTLFAEFLVSLSLIFISNVYSEPNDCGKVPNVKHPGVPNRRNTWPWMVAITKKKVKEGEFVHTCNGVLIDRKHVLTTASCFTQIDNVKDVLARIGKMNQNKGEEYEITCIIKHPNFTANRFIDDIAILTLSRDVKTPNYSPICLPDKELSKKNLDGLEATKVGWGADDQNCGYVSRKDRARGNWPWMVAITQKVMLSHEEYEVPICNGFLIDRRHVLTAAGCPPPTYELDGFTVRVGKKNWNDGEEYKITCVTMHHRYSPDDVYDRIAILTLSRDVDTPNYTPICLPGEDLRTQRLYGLTGIKPLWKSFGSRTLMQFKGLRVISNRDCNKFMTEMLGNSSHMPLPGLVSADMLCTVNPSNTLEPCKGTNGAPLMYKDDTNKWIAIGISIFTFICNTESPRGYIRIPDYVDWIVENTNNQSGECS